MSITDYEAVYALFSNTQGVSVRDADSVEATARYLERNPGLSFVALNEEEVVGCIMSGHDGRRGYLQHLVVSTSFRNKGVAKELVKCALEKLSSLGIYKSHVDVLVTNNEAQLFWEHLGWQKRNDVYRFSFVSMGGPNA